MDHRSEDDVLHPFHHPVAHLPTRRVQRERDHIDLDSAMARITAGLRLLARPATPTIRYDWLGGDGVALVLHGWTSI